MSAAAGGDRLPRLLALLPWLIARPGVSTAAAAAAFGITERQLVADLELLFVCGLPGHGPGDLIDVSWDEGTISVVFDAGLRRPLRLTPDEALPLLVALRALADVPGLRESDALARTLAKLQAAAGDAADAAAKVVVDVEAPGPVLATVQRALTERRRLHLVYDVPARDESTERDVDPMRLHLVEGRSYLEGWCRRAEGVRLFRLDRVRQARLLDVAAEVPDTARPRDLDAGLYRPAPDDVEVVLDLGPAGRWVADYYRCETTEELPDGRLRAVLRTPDTAWVRRLALRLGDQGRVVAPADLAAAVRQEAERALAAYGA